MLTVDASQLKKLARDLKKVDPELLKQLQAGLKKAADTVAVEERLTAGFWSSRIPGTVRPFATGLNAGVRAGGARAPHAAPFEHGGVPGSFRHPVFGHRDVWVSQAARPFAAPALERELPLIEPIVEGAINGAFIAAGWR